MENNYIMPNWLKTLYAIIIMTLLAIAVARGAL